MGPVVLPFRCLFGSSVLVMAEKVPWSSGTTMSSYVKRENGRKGKRRYMQGFTLRRSWSQLSCSRHVDAMFTGEA